MSGGAPSAWDRWDTVWYTRIALTGYTDIRTSAFFPAYPALIRITDIPLGPAHMVLAALLVANVAALFALWGLARVAHTLSAPAHWTLLWLVAAPMGFFLTMGYAESLWLALGVWTLYAARTQRWWLAGTLACAAGLTHMTALALLPLLGILYVDARRQNPWQRAWYQESRRAWLRWAGKGLMVTLAPAVGVGLFAGFCAMRFGDPLAFVHVQMVYWLHHAQWPWTTMALVAHNLTSVRMTSYAFARQWLDVGPVMVAVATLVAQWRTWPRAHWWYTLALLLLVTAAPVIAPRFYLPWISVGRYLLAAFPVQLTLARWSATHPRLAAIAVAACAVLQIWALHLFLTVNEYGVD
jgi:hypothetical protein